ncbi:rhodopirellula transposase [Holospora obtusa F1]|uniref:Rhodopirellula transposase n=2 Tax=Holospora obtusa TaxID=49893 RepID=W6TE89_HOLOB|nr:rhodopirellula transposase [Holospora obtusa F1]
MDKDAQFHYINEAVKEAINNNQPSISVDVKKKENIGEFKDNGQEHVPKGKPIEVETYDFPKQRIG